MPNDIAYQTLLDMTEFRPATLADAFDIYELIRTNSEQLIVRPIGDIVRNIDRFSVAYLHGKLASCGSFTIWPEPADFKKSMVEITSIVVRNDLRGHGIGQRLVKSIIGQLEHLNPEIVIVLTYNPKFFQKLGFQVIPKTEIMHKIYSGCVNCTKQVNPFTCPEVAMGLEMPKKNHKHSTQPIFGGIDPNEY